jgi:hypothetical protein
LSINIWKSIKDKKKINRFNLNNIQQKELNKIDNIFINYIESLGKEQRFKMCLKTRNGYTIIRCCKQMKDIRCNSKWLFKVNVSSGQAKIFLSKQCDHV